MRRLLTIMTGVLVCVLGLPSGAFAGFGLKSLYTRFVGPGGEVLTQAGSHPYAMVTSFTVNTEMVGGEEFPVEPAKDIELFQIPGLIGDQTAVPECSITEFFTEAPENATGCADSTAVGIVKTTIGTGEAKATAVSPLYNLIPSPGRVAKLGFFILSVPVTIDIGVSADPPHELIASSRNISQILEFFSAEVLLWGVPADPVHDKERGLCYLGGSSCTAGVPPRPFLTLPRACQGPLATTYAMDSWKHPGTRLADSLPDLSDPAWVTGEALTHDEAGNPQGMTGCGRLGFAPSITAQPTSRAAESPTGLDVSLDINDEGLKNPAGLAQSDIKKTIVTLPEGMTANPSLAVGLGVCTETDLARESATSGPGEGCPDASKIGTVEVETPLLEDPLRGSLYIAAPYANQFDSLLAVYFVIKDPARGIVIVQAAKVQPDLQTGRLVTTVEDIPQLPFSHFKLHFREGSRSPLVSPPGCGAYNATAELTPWSGGSPITITSAFQVITGPGETTCPTGGTPPFAPEALSGTQNNNAGAYSPFYLRIGRKDGEQELTKFTTTLPAGLTGNLSGIPFCPDAAIEAARQRTGAQETTQPSCPAASEIGHTLVGAGVGGVLAYAPGKVYLAGPYHGSALSVVSITSATVGPFDLGTVVIRFALRINPVTAQVEIDSNGSDPIPHIIQGIVVHVRDIHVYVDREKFILNPTSCNPKSIDNTITGAGANIAIPADDVSVATSDRFQAADCANLGFKPSFKASTSGKTSRNNGAGLSVKLTYPNTPLGTQTNIRSVKVDLPKQLPSRLTTLQKACTDAQFEANPAGCPAASRVGTAVATTPILPVPITGPAYFVSHGGAKFPELILVLQGYGITIDLHGETFISKTGITSSTFHAVPDQPVTSFQLTLPQGPNSALAANGNLCTSALKMPTQFTAQNGMVIKQSTPITTTGCPKKKPKHKAKKAGKASRRHRAHKHKKS
jgi:hypothetical protein